MRMRHKLLTVAAVVLFAVPLAACQGTTTSNANTQSILDRVQQTKTINIGVLDGAPPYSKLGPDGKPQGYDVDIANAIAADLGAIPKFTVVDIPGRVTSLQTKQLDLVVADFTRTPKRALSIDFTVPYLIVRNMFLVNVDSPIKTIADVNQPNVRIAITRGGTAEQWVPALAPNGKLVAFNSEGDCVQAFNSNQADVLTQDNLFNADLMNKNPGKYRIIDGNYPAESISVGMPQGDSKWSRWLDTWMNEFIASGKDAELFKKWFGFDMPPLG